MATTELAEIVPTELVNVETGEALAPTVENVPAVLEAARAMKERLQGVIEAATAVVLEASRVHGTKTFHTGDADVVLSGGPAVEYDPEALADCLREAGCPEDRINEVVKAEISYKVDRSVLRQLVGANPDYRAAAELASREIEKPYRASVKAKR
jgi:hypothetical protein